LPLLVRDALRIEMGAALLDWLPNKIGDRDLVHRHAQILPRDLAGP
jgi:hypothetical protein